MAKRITGIKKISGFQENPYVAISHLVWVEDSTGRTGTTTRVEMYDWINEEKGEAYVQDNTQHRCYLLPTVSRAGTKYVRSRIDSVLTDKLLDLREY